jgi:hypothetical protein
MRSNNNLNLLRSISHKNYDDTVPITLPYLICKGLIYKDLIEESAWEKKIRTVLFEKHVLPNFVNWGPGTEGSLTGIGFDNYPEGGGGGGGLGKHDVNQPGDQWEFYAWSS